MLAPKYCILEQDTLSKLLSDWFSPRKTYITPGKLVRGSSWLCTQNLYANFQPWLTGHPNVNKHVNSPLLIFCQFHSYILKNRTMLFPATLIFMSEKIGVGLVKQAANFLFQCHPDMGSPVFRFLLRFFHFTDGIITCLALDVGHSMGKCMVVWELMLLSERTWIVGHLYFVFLWLFQRRPNPQRPNQIMKHVHRQVMFTKFLT